MYIQLLGSGGRRRGHGGQSIAGGSSSTWTAGTWASLHSPWAELSPLADVAVQPPVATAEGEDEAFWSSPAKSAVTAHGLCQE